MDKLSTVDQFKNNCKSLSGQNSNISDIEIENIILLADSIVRVDLYNIFNQIDIVGSVAVFNLLSQYKSAQLGLEMYFGATKDGFTAETKVWEKRYDDLLKRLRMGMGIYDNSGNKLKSMLKLAEYSSQADLNLEDTL